jgi:hypothetical protein
MRRCICELCQFHRRIKRTQKNGSHRQKNKLIDELAYRLCCAEDSLNYEECVANGSWPTAVEVLEQRLERVKGKKQAEDITK